MTRRLYWQAADKQSSMDMGTSDTWKAGMSEEQIEEAALAELLGQCGFGEPDQVAAIRAGRFVWIKEEQPEDMQG